MTLHFAAFEIAMVEALVPMWRESFEHGVGIVDPHPIDEQRAYLIERVLLYTFACNARARRFYESNGFVAVAFSFEPVWQLDDVRYEWQRRRITVATDPACVNSPDRSLRPPREH